MDDHGERGRMTKSHPVLVLAIPAYNETEGIADFLVDIDQYADLWPGSVGAVVVDDCSTDDTSDRVQKTAAHLEHLSVTVERRDVNRGHGPTLVQALHRSVADGADVVLTVDGDGQFEASDLYRVAREILVPGMDVAIGVRKFRLDPWFRKVVTRSLRTFARVRYGVRLADVNSPLRAYRVGALTELMPVLPADTLVPNVRLSIEMSRRDTRVAELYVTHRVRRGRVSEGTSWGGRNRALLVPGRLLKFCWAALREVWSL
jgi:glycosyltransferase involved in cell wall biosynthesis